MTGEEMAMRLAAGEQLTLNAQDMAALMHYHDMKDVQEGMAAAQAMAEPLNAEQVQNLLGRYANTRTRFAFFVELASTYAMTAEAYAKGLRDAYITGQPQDRYEALRCFYAVRDRRALMNEEEQKALQDMPARVQLFRGCSIDEYHANVYGSSWTTQRSVAEFFAWRFDKQDSSRCVVSCIIDKAQVLAVFMERKEHEVVADIMGTAAGVTLEADAPTAAYLERVRLYGEHSAAFGKQ
jgi:hypothetical protein